jgi:LuxR family maltose regulon positive regulatory protein
MTLALICLQLAREVLAPPSPGTPLSFVGAQPAPDGEEPTPARLGVLFAQLAAARLQGDSIATTAGAAEIQHLLALLPTDREGAVRGLAVVLDGHLASLEVNRGNLHEAACRLARGADRAPDSSGYRGARADCAGQLALVEAFRGDLTLATQHVAAVAEESATSASAGVPYARLATAWVHLEQGENARARQILDAMAPAIPGSGEPWLVTAQLLAEARLLIAEDRPETALRLLAPAAKAAADIGDNEWLTDLLVLASAEALIAAGEPRRALAVITPVPARARAEAGVLAATARRDIGDPRGARAGLDAAAAQLTGAPLGVQIRAWVLEARLAHADGRDDRAELLVSRALRAASAEGLRRPLANDSSWLRAFLERDPPLKREYRVFLASLTALVPARPIETPPRQESRHSGGIVLEPLTGRELEVLELLAQMYATDEIATQLHLSVNTIKTHIKGLFRKLSVNRRTAAVRRGRELGLC